jgi:hypothetical protein
MRKVPSGRLQIIKDHQKFFGEAGKTRLSPEPPAAEIHIGLRFGDQDGFADMFPTAILAWELFFSRRKKRVPFTSASAQRNPHYAGYFHNSRPGLPSPTIRYVAQRCSAWIIDNRLGLPTVVSGRAGRHIITKRTQRGPPPDKHRNRMHCVHARN